MIPELLSPVQDFVSLNAAINAGADSVFFGLKEFNLRQGAKNFELKELEKVIRTCHDNNVKVYITLNSIIYDKELLKIKKILKKLKKIDAVIAWDFFVINECDKLNLPIHLSTQASVSNFETVLFLKSKIKNLKRINLARELSMEQIKHIVKKIKQEKLNVEIETFVHGAMCVSISGRCFLSQEVFNKSANRGSCLQPCRRKYIIKDIEEKHEYLIGEEYVMSPKDLCTINIIDDLVKSGIHAFKIEGRNRSPEYVKTVTECYREAIDYYKNKSNKKADIKKKLIKRLKTVYNRGFSTGFYLGRPADWTDDYGSKSTKKKVYLGRVLNYYIKKKAAEIKLENGNLKLGQELMISGNKTGITQETVKSIEINSKKVNIAVKGQRIGVELKNKVRENDKVYLVLNK
ncbi:MAG: U32 family peptidase [Nanoarchaeota archaeon]